MGMFVIAVDVGVGRVSAAVARRTPAGDVDATPFSLGRAGGSASSAVHVGDSDLVFGDAAERRGLSSPERLLRGVVERVGEDVPYLVGRRSLLPADVFAAIVAWVVAAGREREGADPSAVAVTVPATWGPHRTDALEAALSRQGVPRARLVSAAEAVATEYETASPVRPGRGLAVYDFGAHAFRAAVLRAERGGRVRLAGTPVEVAGLGGSAVDDALLARVLGAAGLAPDAPEFTAAPHLVAGALRREVLEAKEALSFDADTVVPVIVGGGGAVRVTRGELESIVEPLIERTMEALGLVMDSARMTSADLDAVLLVGGSSRIPRVAQMLSERFARTVVVDADPTAVAALGAARAAAAALDVSAPDSGITATPATAPGREPRRSWFARAFSGAATGTAAVLLTTGIVLGTGGSLAADISAAAVDRGGDMLDVRAGGDDRTPTDRSEEPAVAAPAPGARPERPDRGVAAPPADGDGPATAPDAIARPHATAPSATAPSAAPSAPPTSAPSPSGGAASSPLPDETTTTSSEPPPADSAPPASEPTPTEPGPPDTAPPPVTQPATQPDSSTPPPPGIEPDCTGTVD
jgi:hypothetical protein